MKNFFLTIHYIFLVNIFLFFDMEHCVQATMLYGSDSDTGALYLIDTTTAESVEVGSFGVSGYMAGLAYDADNDIMYGTTTSTNKLYSIDYSTGSATFIGDLNASYMHSLAYDNSTNTLFGAYGGFDEYEGLYQIDVTTGNATFIGNIDNYSDSIHGLAIHPETYDLYGVLGGRGSTKALFQIDKNTGTGTLLYEYDIPNFSSLAFMSDCTLYATDNWSGNLYTLDISNGSTNLIGNTGLGNPLGLTSIPEPTTMVLLGFGCLSLFSRKKRNCHKRNKHP